MHKIPLISGEKIVKCLTKYGYKISRQKGSHIRLHHLIDKSKKPITIPKHKELGKGLLRKILRDAEISIEELIKLL